MKKEKTTKDTPAVSVNMEVGAVGKSLTGNTILLIGKTDLKSFLGKKVRVVIMERAGR